MILVAHQSNQTAKTMYHVPCGLGLVGRLFMCLRMHDECYGKRGRSGFTVHLLGISAAMQSGVVGRHD